MGRAAVCPERGQLENLIKLLKIQDCKQAVNQKLQRFRHWVQTKVGLFPDLSRTELFPVVLPFLVFSCDSELQHGIGILFFPPST